jgi:serine/threonine protein kinase/Tol biopolymer transport system component
MKPGDTLGTYQVLAKLGEGGMGEVYRALDTRLNRDVAIKVLPDLFARDADRLARFTREARTLASLNHPNIAQIHGLEDVPAEGPAEAGHHRMRALVMELVEGEDLSQRIARGAIPIDEALPIAKQITDALEAAHEQGIIHRDLKPANIKLRPDGTVKVLDFGLAKLADPAGAPGAEAMNSPTMTSPAMMTRAGVILGTAAYMSPEQAKGKAVDKRTDIWAFGCVVYELLTGRRAFAGTDVTDLVVAVLTKEPDWTALPPPTPPRIVELLKRCLKKVPRERLHDIADARVEIEDTIARGSNDESASLASPARLVGATDRQKLAWALLGSALAAVVGGAALVVSGVLPRSRPPDTRPLRVSIVHPEVRDVSAPAISPDGRRVAYAARRIDGMPMLWVRDLATGEARALPGTEDASQPFWSPDSRDLGFLSGPFLKRVPADGGPIQVVAEGSYGGAWAPDGTIIFSRGGELLRVNTADAGEATPVTKLQGKDWRHDWPSFLPDGRRFLFVAKLWTRAAETSEQGIYLGSLDDPTSIRRILPDLSSAVYAPPGLLVFVRDGTLTAAPFDLTTGRVTGSPAPIGGAVAVDGGFYQAAVSAAADGTLAVRPPPAVALLGVNSHVSSSELHLVDRTGTGRRVGTAQPYSYYAALNPDGRRLAASLIDSRTGTTDLWLVNLEGGDPIPITTTRGYAGAPVWSPDGTRLAYAYQPPGQMDDVYIKDLRNGQLTRLIESQAVMEHPIAWSHDAAHLLVKRENWLCVWSFASRTLTRFVGSFAKEATFSPDDRYVAFSSLESGRSEVCVTTFPERRQTWSLTTEGGQVLSWRADGREILVATPSGHIVAYPVSTDRGGFAAGQPTVLLRDIGYAAPYSAATRDHSKILIRVSPDAAKDKGEIRLLFGWADAWRQGKPLTPR